MAALLKNLHVTSSSSKRLSDTDWQGKSADELDSVFALADDAEQTSLGLRSSSKSTQNTQDRHLEEYRSIISADLRRKNKGDGLSLRSEAHPAINDHLLFPADANELIENLCRYLVVAASLIVPKRQDKKNIRAGTILSRQKSMLYWITRGGKATGLFDNHKAAYYKRTAETMEFLKQRIGFSCDEKRRVYLGRDELEHLIDVDLRMTTQVPVHEQHALAWIIGLICGIRPGSLCATPDYPERYLRLHEIKIQREVSSVRPTGSFIATLTFSGLKGQDRIRNKAPKFLHVKCRTPSRNEDIGLSIPHRILVILLRRRLLRDHDSVDSLLNGNELYIRLKPGCGSQPLLFASKPKGDGLADLPLNTNAVHEYLKLRAQWAGFKPGVSFYSWRAKALTQANEVAGTKTAKMLAAHDVDSTSFEDYYDQGLYKYDAVGVALDSEQDKAAVRQLADMESELLHRIPLEKQSVVRSQFVDSFVRKHPVYKEAVQKHGVGTQKMTSITQKLRAQVVQSCLAEEREMGSERLTVAEYRQRQDEVNKPSALYEGIERQFQKLRKADVSSLSDQMPTITSSRDLNDEDEDENDEQYRDFEDDRGASDITSQATVLLDEDNEQVDIGDNYTPDMSADFIGAAAAFMDLMLTYSDAASPRSDLMCQLCQDDPTADEKHKSARYIAANLQKHVEGRYHFPYYQWKRAFDLKLCGQTKDVECPYGCGKTWKYVDAVIKHLKKSYNPEKDSDEHERLKQEDGWYSPGFYGPEELGVQQKMRKQNDVDRLHRERYDVDAMEIEGLVPGLWRGAPEAGDMIEFGREAAAEAARRIPKYLLTDDVASAMSRESLRGLLVEDEVKEDGLLSSIPHDSLVPIGGRAELLKEFYPDVSAVYRNAHEITRHDE